MTWRDASAPAGGCVPVTIDVAAEEFAATAFAAAEVLGTVAHGLVEVSGDGVLATLVRHLVRGVDGPGPGAIIETSGSPAAFRDALHRSDPLGTVVLAGPPCETSVELPTYHDLHVRGTVVVGVPWRGNPSHETPPELVALARDQLASAEIGVPLPDAPWIRLVV